MDAEWRDSRGVNDFEQVKTLTLCGTPRRNLADIQMEYAVLSGVYDKNDAGFRAFDLSSLGSDEAIAPEVEQLVSFNQLQAVALHLPAQQT